MRTAAHRTRLRSAPAGTGARVPGKTESRGDTPPEGDTPDRPRDQQLATDGARAIHLAELLSAEPALRRRPEHCPPAGR